MFAASDGLGRFVDSISLAFDYIDLHTRKVLSVAELNKKLQGATTGSTWFAWLWK